MQLLKPNNRLDLQKYLGGRQQGGGGEEGSRKDISTRVMNKVNLMSFAVLYFRARRLYGFLWSVMSPSRAP